MANVFRLLVVRLNELCSWARDYLLSLGELDYQEPIQMADELKSAQIKKEFEDLINLAQ